MVRLTLPTGSEDRKDVPVLSGCLNYFPAAMAWIARISVIGDRKHNKENAGNPPFHARGKSMDHGDCVIRHTMDMEDLKAWLKRAEGAVTPADYHKKVVRQLLEEAAYRAWRSCAELQQLCEQYDNAPLAPAARLPEDTGQQFAGEVKQQFEQLVKTGGLMREDVNDVLRRPLEVGDADDRINYHI